MRLQNQNDVEFKSNFQLFQSQGQQSRLKLKLSNLVDSVIPSQSSYLSQGSK